MYRVNIAYYARVVVSFKYFLIILGIMDGAEVFLCLHSLVVEQRSPKLLAWVRFLLQVLILLKGVE